MVHMEEENIKLFNEEETKHISRKIPKKPSKIGKTWRLCYKYQLMIKTDNTHERWSNTNISDGNKPIQMYYCANIAITGSGLSGKWQNTWGNTTTS